MELLMLKHIKGLGNEGDIVKVKEGYARNYLLPKKLAVKASAADINLKESLRKKGETRKIQELEDLKAVVELLAKVEVEIKVKVGKGGKMFGSVTSLDIAKALAEKDVKVDRKKIVLESPIKSLGEYKVNIKLHKDVAEVKIKVNVVDQGQDNEENVPVSDEEGDDSISDQQQQDEIDDLEDFTNQDENNE